MQWSNTAERYGAGPRMLHWLMAVLVIAALFCIEARGWAPRGAWRRGFTQWHQQAALLAFLLVWLRIALRVRNTAPPISLPLPMWQARVGTLLHWLFYALLIVLPLLGMVMVELDGRTVALFGAELPRFVEPDKVLTHRLEKVHGLLGNVMIGAIALHVTAALWHHFVRHDNTLRRML